MPKNIYQKGHKKIAGRKPGSKNKNTLIIREFAEYILLNGKADWDKIWDGLKPKEQADVIVKLFPYSIPQMARVENENKVPHSITINMIPASPERLEQNNTIDITHSEINEETDD